MPRHTAAAIGLAALLCFSFGAQAEFQTPAREAILIDMSTNTVLFEKDADLPMPPASMSKIMTSFMVFEKLHEGSLSLDDTFTVSEKAWRKGGSKMFVEVGKQIRVEDLLRGVIVQSGNDASIVLAEGLAGIRGGLRRGHDPEGRRDRADQLQLRECDRLAGPSVSACRRATWRSWPG